MDHSQKLMLLQNLGQGAIYLIGMSFIIGSLFTIFVLIIFDWVKYERAKSRTIPGK